MSDSQRYPAHLCPDNDEVDTLVGIAKNISTQDKCLICFVVYIQNNDRTIAAEILVRRDYYHFLTMT